MDDLLLFASGDSVSNELLLEGLNEFAKALGLAANHDKSEIFFVEVNDSEQQ